MCSRSHGWSGAWHRQRDTSVPRSCANHSLFKMRKKIHEEAAIYRSGSAKSQSARELAHGEKLGPRGFDDHLVLRQKLDTDTRFVMTGDTAWHLADEHKFADGRAALRDQRNARERKIEYFAIHNIAAGACEAGHALVRRALVAAQRRFVEHAAIHVERKLLGNAFTLVLRAMELNSKAALLQARDITFEAAKAVDVNDDLGARRRNDIAKDARATGRQIGDLAISLTVFRGFKLTAGQLHALAFIAPAFGH